MALLPLEGEKKVDNILSIVYNHVLFYKIVKL